MITTLNQLVKRVCANYDTERDDECLLRTDKNEEIAVTVEEECLHCQCLVLNSKACCYFRRYVLPPKDYKYCPDLNLEKLRYDYSLIDPRMGNVVVSQRTCACGKPLQPRKRMCDKCKVAAKRETKAKYRQNRRNNSLNRDS